MKTKDLTGMKFGRLTARVKLPSLKPGDGFRWECDCECGGKAIVKARLLTYKHGTRSCGCLLREKNQSRPVRGRTNLKHGHAIDERKTGEYSSWSSMVQRCTNPKNRNYCFYGARGVTVCQEWLESFDKFLADMGPRPEAHSIDRINPKLGYSKENCRWANAAIQASNKTNSRRITAFGQTNTCGEASLLYGIPERTLYGWSRLSATDIESRINAYRARAKRPASI